MNMRSIQRYHYDEETGIKKKKIDDRQELLMHINMVKKALDCANSNFEYVTEPELVDIYIYELKAIQLKYEYLINKAKELGIIADPFSYTDKKA